MLALHVHIQLALSCDGVPNYYRLDAFCNLTKREILHVRHVDNRAYDDGIVDDGRSEEGKIEKKFKLESIVSRFFHRTMKFLAQ